MSVFREGAAVDKAAEEAKRLSRRRLAIVPDAKTVAEIKHVAAGKAALATIRIKRQLFARGSRYQQLKKTALEMQ